MALKQRFKTEPTFSMASMTDVIFLLLIFFYDHIRPIVVPNSIKFCCRNRNNKLKQNHWHV